MYVFRNKGVIDPRSITTFGVSSKEGKAPIGFFGTGLKYAIAVLLRNKCSITIWSGGNEYAFTHQKVKIRHDEFDVVCMNNEPVGFTTELGKTWEMWQAFRELACNTIDENGTYFESEDISPQLDETIIVVSGAAFADTWRERDTIILPSKPMFAGKLCEVHHGSSTHIYYRGVRVSKLDKPSLFTYNLIEKIDLTEDRTIKFPWYATDYVYKTIAMCEWDKIITDVVTASQLAWESSLYFSGSAYSEVFKTTVLKLAKAFANNLNASAKKLVHAGSLNDLLAGEKVVLSKLDDARVKKATQFLAKLGYEVSEYPLRVSEFLGDSVLGAAQNGTIYISRRCLMMGTKMLAGTILEEYLHLKHKLDDESRGMQNFLFDALMSMGEQVTGEPL